ncbi:MAG: lipid-A-disaccharide synthase, partial [Rhodovulum sp.]|nr:lipid-A-disaccharide synthase [Rhodovulum sp.]
MRRVFLIAGEASGDALGAALMQGLKTLCPEGIEFTGVGGELMQAEGLHSLFPMRELSVMGIAEVLPKYRALMRRINQCADQIVTDRPDVLITIDSPDFSLRVARRVKERSDIRTVHYVAPTVWAWRSGRAKKMAPIIDQVLAL